MTVRPYGALHSYTHSVVALSQYSDDCSTSHLSVLSLRVITVALVMTPSVPPCLRAFDSI